MNVWKLFTTDPDAWIIKRISVNPVSQFRTCPDTYNATSSRPRIIPVAIQRRRIFPDPTRIPLQNGSGSFDVANAIAMKDDGSVVVAGSTAGDWDIPSIGGRDFAAFSLDANGDLLWKWQVYILILYKAECRQSIYGCAIPTPCCDRVFLKFIQCNFSMETTCRHGAYINPRRYSDALTCLVLPAGIYHECRFYTSLRVL